MEAAGARSMAVAGARNTTEVMDEDTDVDPAEAGTDRSLVRESFKKFRNLAASWENLLFAYICDSKAQNSCLAED